MRILYVEDNATNVILVQRVANMGKHEVINYDDGQVALDQYEKDKPDLILLDVQLRGALTGLDVAHRLRMKGCTLPVIAVTAYAMKGDRQRCLDAGCDDYLPKPISVAELVTVFKRFGDAVAAGKPIVSTFKFQTSSSPALVHAAPAPIVLTPAPVVDPIEAKPAPVTDPAPVVIAPPTSTLTPEEVKPAPIVDSSPAAPLVETPVAPVEPTPKVADALSVVTVVTPNPITVANPVTVTSAPDSLAERTPTPMNAEP